MSVLWQFGIKYDEPHDVNFVFFNESDFSVRHFRDFFSFDALTNAPDNRNCNRSSEEEMYLPSQNRKRTYIQC